MYADLCASLQKRRLPFRCEIKPRRPPHNAHRFMGGCLLDRIGQRLGQCPYHFANDYVVTLISTYPAGRAPIVGVSFSEAVIRSVELIVQPAISSAYYFSVSDYA